MSVPLSTRTQAEGVGMPVERGLPFAPLISWRLLALVSGLVYNSCHLQWGG